VSRTRAVFLDRDGTITVERGHITRPGELELIPGAAGAVSTLNRMGVPAIVVSNQSGVARGLMTEADLARIHRRLEELLAAAGARLDGAYYCPNYAGGSVERYTRDTSCRKPETGMLEQAGRDLGIEVARSYMVGDQLTDIELAANGGLQGILVGTGKGTQTLAMVRERGLPLALFAEDLGEAVRWIAEDLGESS